MGTGQWDSTLEETSDQQLCLPPPLPFAPPHLPVTRGNVARVGLGFSCGFCPARSGTRVRFLRALERRSSRMFPPAFWMNFFSTYFERIHDSFSPLGGGGRSERHATPDRTNRKRVDYDRTRRVENWCGNASVPELLPVS